MLYVQLLKTSAEMAAGQTQLVREVEHLKQKAGNMVELETFTGLQVGDVTWIWIWFCMSLTLCYGNSIGEEGGGFMSGSKGVWQNGGGTGSVHGTSHLIHSQMCFSLSLCTCLSVCVHEFECVCAYLCFCTCLSM